MKSFFSVIICSLAFLLYQYDYQVILNKIRTEIQPYQPFSWFKLMLFNCYLLFCPAAIATYYKKLPNSLTINLTLTLTFVILILIGEQLLHIKYEAYHILISIIISLATPLYYILLLTYIQFLRNFSITTKGICISIILSFDFLQIIIEHYLGTKKNTIHNICFYALFGSLLLTPIFSYHTSNSKLSLPKNFHFGHFRLSLSTFVMTFIYVNLLSSDYSYFYNEKFNQQKLFQLYQSIAQFVTPLIVCIIYQKHRDHLIYLGWIYVSLLTGLQYIILRMIIKNVNFFLTCSLTGILNSYHITYFTLNDGYIPYYLISQSLSTGGFYLFSAFLNRFYQGILGCILLQGILFLTVLLQRRKLNQKQE